MKRMFTKALNLFSVLLLLVAIGFSFFAVTQPNEVSAAWDGTVATSFSSGSGTASSPYMIATEKQLGYFMSQLASGVTYEGQYIKLSKSLNMTGSIWDTSHYTAFGGVFDGQGYTITADCPFMTVIGETGVVQGLNYNTYHIQLGRALICDTNNGIIRSCTAYGDVYATSGSPVYGGMICTKNTGTVENCGAIGKLYASGDDTSAYAAMVPQNSGTVTGCYSAITVGALGTGKYSDEEYCPVSHRGFSTNSFYDKTLHPYTAHCGEGLTTAELQSDAFLSSLQGTSVTGTRWVKGSHGYPELAHCSTSYAYVSGYQGNTEPIIYSGTSKTITLYSSSTSSNIYYTLDGTDPSSSSTRKTLYSGYTMSISGDTVLTMVPYYNGTYGTVTRQTFINLQGSGTASSPYKITTKRQLNAIRMLPDKTFALKNDLTFTDADFTLGGIAAGGWSPIASFSGKLDGEGHAVTGLRSNHGGLFNDVETGATVTSLRLMDHKLCSPGDFGAIAKHNYGTITRCYVKSAFTVANAPSGKEPNSGFPYIGGVVAFNRGTVSYCRNDGLTVGLGVARYGEVYMGGITGSNQGTLESCVNFGGILLRNNAHAGNGYFGGITGTGDVYEANCRSRCDMTLQNSFDYSVVCTGMSGEDPYLACVASLCIADPFTVSWSIPGAYSTPTTNKYAISGLARDSYTLQDRAVAESYPALNFSSDWMFTQEGPMPQGVMDENGHCLRTSAYIVPSCTEAGSVTLYCELCSHVETQTLDKIPHSYSAYVSDGNATCLEDGTKTRTCSGCGLKDTVADEGSALGHTYENGFCVRCDARESAADKNNDGIWEIGNAGQLYWFAELVNGGQLNASAVLTADITVNTGVLNSQGLLSGSNLRVWMPMGNAGNMYTGTFDGCGHTVSGLYRDALTSYCGFFGYVGEGGIVRNLGLTDSFFKGDKVVGSIAASCSGLIENCFNTATVVGVNEIGGISGSLFNSGIIRSCYSAGRIRDTGSATDIAGIVSYANSSATVENCFYLDSSETDHYDGTTAMNAEQFASGEVAWKLNGDQSSICFRQTCGQGLPAFTGSQVFRNQVGGCTTNAEYRYSNTQEVPVLVHTFNVYTGNGDATCLEDGTRTAKCDLCDATDTVTDAGTALGHSFTQYSSDGNEGCYTDGTETAKCDRCETTDTRTEVGSAGHLFTNYVSNNNATCIYPGTMTAKCDRCDVKDTKVEAGSQKGHNFTNYISNGDATCLTDGTKTAKCDRCTVTETLPDEGSALGHGFTNYVSDGNVTCTEDGTQTAKCDRCDVTDTTVLEALGHDMGQWFTVTEASCTASGLEQRDCARCSHSETRIIPILPHSFEGVITEPTCTQQGYTTYTCHCGESYVSDKMPSLGHSFTEYVSDGNATCTADGTQTAKCDRCEETDTIQLKALGHSYTNYTSIGNATCTADGLKIATCDRCPEMDFAVDVGSMLGHSFTQYVSNGDASCTENGTETAKCDRCDETDTREEADSALGHDLAAWYNVAEATCTEEGLERADCSRCDHSETLPIPATGHSYTEEIIEPTCTEGGSTVHRCHCGNSYQDSYTEMLGHSFSQYVSNVDAGCTENGTETAKCDRCEETDTREEADSALGHSFGDWIRDEDAGIETATCERCGETVDRPITEYSGVCGDDLRWTFNTVTGELRISGKGDMYDYDDIDVDAPWLKHEAGITSLILEEGITHIGGQAFDIWYDFTEITLPESLTSIGRYAFSHSRQLTRINIPKNLVSIGSPLFSGCENLEEFLVDPENPCYSSADGVLYNKDQTALLSYPDNHGEEFVIPGNVTAIGEYAFYYAARLHHVTIPDGVTMIGKNAFDWSGIEEIVLPEGLTRIESYTFASCTSLRSISIPDSVTSIGSQAFIQCAIEEIRLPETITYIGDYAFTHCESLKSIVIPEGITTIDYGTFRNCYSLESITIPQSVTVIQNNAFEGCDALTDVYYGGTEEMKELLFIGTENEALVNANWVCRVCEHRFGDWETVTAATCLDDGEEIRYCSNCIAVETKVIPAAGHAYESVVTEPTCLDQGYTTHTCHCGYSYQSSFTAKLDHSFTDYVSNGDAGCTENGTETAKCDRCDVTDTRVETGSALGHEMGGWYTITEPTCTEEGVERADCGRCDHFETQAIAATGHSHTAAVTEPTCLDQGYTTYTCHCGDSYVDNYTDALDHDYIEVFVDPTCINQGYTLITCGRCDLVGMSDHTDPLGHSFTQYVSNGDATCTEDGTETAKCDRCEETETREDDGSALGHDMGQWYTVTEVACTENGVERADCRRCDYSEERIIAAAGHDHKTVVTAPSCTEGGYTTHSCHCGDTYVDSYTKALGHSFTRYVSNGDATCTEGGTETAKCDRCDETDTRTKMGSALGHKFGQWVRDEENATETGTCERCGHTEVRDLVLASGVCGENVTWKVKTNGTLLICGNGGMYDYYEDSMPWASYRNNIKALAVENGVTYIGQHAFSGCRLVTDVRIPDTVTRIGNHAFQSCLMLSNVSVPEGVTEIGSHAFYNCSGLKQIALPDSVSSIGGFAFYNCSSLASIEIPSGVTEISEYLFMDCRRLTSVTIPDSVTRIGYQAFCNCNRLKSIRIPESVTVLDDYAFSGCLSLADISLPDTVTDIGESTFVNCESLETIQLPANLSFIEEGTFMGCGSLKRIEIPEGVLMIGESAFESCYQLTEIMIPESVIRIGANAFRYCSYGVDAHVYYAGTEDQWADLDCDCPESMKIHYSCTDPDSHWRSDALAATCENDGYTREICDCGHIRNEVIISMMGHDWSEWETVQEATCVETGISRRDCSRCDAFETKESPTNYNHSYTAVVILPTCTEQGYTKHICDCGNSYASDYTDMLGHSFTQYVSNGDAACTADGTETAKCDRCDVTGTRVVADSALGHDLNDWHTVTEATCVDEGREESGCSRCDHKESRSIPATGVHDYSEAVETPPTCTEQGYTVHNCYYCGEVGYVDNYVDPTGHSFGQWYWVEDEMYRDCLDCDHKENIPYAELHPEAPVLSIATDSETGKPRISWNALENIEKYRIYRSTKETSGFEYLKSTQTVTSFTDTSAEVGVTYYYKIKAYHAVSGLSSEWSNTVRFSPQLEAPVVSITGNAASGKPTVKWETVEGAAKYRVYRSLKKTSGFELVYTGITARSYTDKTAEAGTNYYYKVKAYLADGKTGSPWSETVNRVCDLAAPTVTITGNSATGKPTVKWETVEGAIKYRVYRSESKSSGYELVYTGITARSYTDKTAEAGINYYYKVKAIHEKSSADSAYSTVVNRVCDLAKPVVEIKLTSSGDPRLTWEAIEGAVKYRVYRCDVKDGEYELVKTTVTATSFTDKEAEAGTTWYYKVRAIHENSSANSAYSTILSITAE